MKAERRSRRRPRRCPGRHGARHRPVARPPTPLPGRPPGRAASGSPTSTTVGALTAAELERPCTSARSRPSPTSPRRGGCPGSRPACASPTAARGTRSRPTSRCGTTSSRRRTRSTTRSRAARRRSSPASSATCCSRWCSTRSSPPRQGVFDMTDVWTALGVEDRPPPPARVRRRRGPHRLGREPPVGADQGRRARRGRGRRRRGADGSARAEERARRDQPLAARARREPGDAGAGREPGLRLAVDRRRAGQGARGGRRARGSRDDAEHRAEELGDLLFVLVNVGRKTGIEVEAALRAANEKFRRRFRHVELAAAAQGVALRDLSFEELDALWDAAKADERGEATA